MKSPLSFTLSLVVFFLGSFIRLSAEDWTTTDGKVYQNVNVVKAEPDAVTITDHDGGALIPLTKLPPDLQKRFNYDPVKAKAAADVRTQNEAKNAVALQAEMNQARDQKQAALIALDPRPSQKEPSSSHLTHNTPTGPIDPVGQSYIPTSSSWTDTASSPQARADAVSAAAQAPAENSSQGNSPFNSSSDPLATNSHEITHHSMDELVDINSRLKDDHPSENRHTASSLLLASKYLMPDPLDPTHHSTDSLINSVGDLSKPGGDSTSH